MGSIPNTTQPLAVLANDIAVNCKVLTDYLIGAGLPQPSFASDGPTSVLPPSAPKETQQAKAAIAEAAFKLHSLVTGPSELIPNITAGYQTTFALRWLVHFNIFSYVPLRGSVPYAEIASEANVPEKQLRAVARMAMTNNIFVEPKPNRLAHSASSAMLATNTSMLDWAKFMFNASIPTAAKMVEATEKWPDSVEKNETAYNLAFDHNLPFFGHLSQDATLTKQFSGYMKSVADGSGTDLIHLVNAYDWSALPADTLIIDVGGSTGHGTFALAKAFHQLKFEVQDLPEVAKNGNDQLSSQPQQVSSRVSFRGHDFFQAQPVQGAPIYLLRMILHDWAEKEAVQILSNLVPALADGSKILIMDTVLPDPGTIPATKERMLRVRDLTMRQVFNSQERTMSDWEELVNLADSRLKITGANQPNGSNMSLITVELQN